MIKSLLLLPLLFNSEPGPLVEIKNDREAYISFEIHLEEELDFFDLCLVNDRDTIDIGADRYLGPPLGEEGKPVRFSKKVPTGRYSIESDRWDVFVNRKGIEVKDNLFIQCIPLLTGDTLKEGYCKDTLEIKLASPDYEQKGKLSEEIHRGYKKDFMVSIYKSGTDTLKFLISGYEMELRILQDFDKRWSLEWLINGKPRKIFDLSYSEMRRAAKMEYAYPKRGGKWERYCGYDRRRRERFEIKKTVKDWPFVLNAHYSIVFNYNIKGWEKSSGGLCVEIYDERYPRCDSLED